ncbi:MAG: hypothetical protein AAGD38_19360 [Acidobacteriota bacterium]
MKLQTVLLAFALLLVASIAIADNTETLSIEELTSLEQSFTLQPETCQAVIDTSSPKLTVAEFAEFMSGREEFFFCSPLCSQSSCSGEYLYTACTQTNGNPGLCVRQGNCLGNSTCACVESPF